MKLQQETPVNVDAVKDWTVTPEGWLQIDIPLRSPGVLNYDTQKGDAFTAKEYVSQEELFAPESMKTLIGKPVTVSRHPKSGKVTAQNYRAVNAGTVIDVFREGDDLISRVHIQDADAIQLLKRNKRMRGASAGYACGEKSREAGNYDGMPYDTVQKRIVYNHMTIVSNPRNKKAVFNLDGKEDMAKTLEELQEENTELTTNCDALTADKEKLTKKVNQLNGELAEARKKILNLDSESNDAYERGLKDGEQRHAINEHAKAMGINVDSLEPKLVKLAIIKKVNDKMNCDSLSDDQIDTALEMALASKPAPAFNQKKRENKPNTDSNPEGNGGDGFIDYQKELFGGK